VIVREFFRSHPPAEVIRIAQSLGMSLKEIAAFTEERRKGHLTSERRAEIMSAQLVSLEAKATELTNA
jgi:MerR family copper efflux transcriptional regulator